MYQFPLTMSFKKIALAPQITVRDNAGTTLMYVKQKLLKLKEEITVFTDANQTSELYKIHADRIIDFSAKYHFTDAQTQATLGAVKRQGRRSLWSARYDIFDTNNFASLHITEDSAMVKVMDALFGEIPIIGLLSGYVFNPTYSVLREDGSKVVSIKKKPALLESEFIIDEVEDIKDAAEINVILSIIMMTLLERSRG